MSPIVDRLEAEFPGEAAFLRMNAEDEDGRHLMTQFALRGHPAFALLDQNGRLAQTFSGSQSEEQLRQAITAVLSAAQ